MLSCYELINIIIVQNSYTLIILFDSILSAYLHTPMHTFSISLMLETNLDGCILKIKN